MDKNYIFGLIVAMGLGGTISYTFFYGGITGTQEEKNEINKVTLVQDKQPKNDIQMLNEKNLALKKSIVNLESRLNRLITKYQNIQQTVATENYLNEFSDDSSGFEEKSTENDSESLSQLELTFHKLEKHFNNDTHTDEQADSFAAKLTDLFHKQANLFDNNLIESACNTDICRVEIQHQNIEAETNFIKAAASTSELESIGDLFVYNIPSEETEDGLAHSVYFLAKKGHQLPVSLRKKKHDPELEKMTRFYR